MSLRTAITIAIVLTLLVTVGLAPHIQARSQRSLPQVAGTMPEVEGPILQALQAASLTGQLIWIAADTNGHLTIAWLVMTYSDSLLDPLPALQAYAWDLVRTTFAAVPSLDEVHLSGLPQGESPFGSHRHFVTFSAAISRAEFLAAPRSLTAREVLAILPRVWIHPALLQPEGHSPTGDRLTSAGPRTPFMADRSIRFWGNRKERATELGRQIAGLAYGGIAGGILYQGDPSRQAVALTFDDGPFPIYTTLLLDTLDRLQLKATFFLVGEQVQQYPYFAQAIVRAGHEVGNHTFHHPNLIHLSEQQVEEEIARTQEVVATVTGQTPRYFRPPGGDYNRTVLRTVRRLGLMTVFWTDDPGDYANIGPRALEAKTLARITNGGILLLHQGVEDTIRVLPHIAEVLRRRGFAITTVSGLLLPGRANRSTR